MAAGRRSARAAATSALTQGVAVATGLQSSFSWRAVAASAAGAYVGQQVDQVLQGSEAMRSVFGTGATGRFVTSAASGFAAGTTAAVFQGGKYNITQVATDAFGNALGNSLADMSSSSNRPLADNFADDHEARIAANPISSWLDKQNRAQEAAEILASQAANESQGSGQDNGYPAVPYTPGDFAGRSTFPGATLGAFMGVGGGTKGLDYDPSKPHVIVYGQRLSKDQWAAIDRYEAGQTTAEFGAGVWDGVKSLPGGVWNGVKTVGDGYRGLAYLLSGNIDSFRPRSNVTLDSIGRGIYHSSPLGIVGSFTEGRYRQAGSDTFGTAVGFATTKFGPSLNNVPGLNSDVGALSKAALRSFGETASIRLENYLGKQGFALYAAPPGNSTPFSATQLRNTPGVASVSSELSQASEGWINAGVPAPIPAQIANSLAGKTFNTFDDLRSAIWQQVGNTPELTVGFSRANIGQMKGGNAPFAPTEYLTESGAFGDRFNIHHVEPIAWGGGVYDLSNLQIVSPKVHYNIHYGR